jgi:hypothetical protein
VPVLQNQYLRRSTQTKPALNISRYTTVAYRWRTSKPCNQPGG